MDLDRRKRTQIKLRMTFLGEEEGVHFHNKEGAEKQAGKLVTSFREHKSLKGTEKLLKVEFFVTVN